MRSFSWKYSAAVACVLVAVSVRAEAQVCGDADGNGTVTVSDGVQALRAAAGLPSNCSATSCDVDGSGTITVTDGVNVLRKAAGITITEACAAGTDNLVASALRQSVPVFGGFGQLSKLGSPSGANVADASCENTDGTVTFDAANNEVDFNNCTLAGLTYDGFVSVEGTTLFLDLDITDDVGDDINFVSDTGLTVQESGSNVVLAGQLDITDFAGDLGDLSVTFENLVTDPDGNSIGGSLLFDASASDIEGISAFRISFNGTSTIEPVDVILPDQSVQHFNFDTASGTLTPAATS